jgi:hypothetical protein
MTNPLFGWSLQDVVKLVQTCERFYQAYRDGPGGASTHITNFKEQVDNCHHVLELIREELFDQDRTLPSRKQKYDALEATLLKCSKIFETSEFLKAKGDRKVLKKLFASANYLFKVKENIQQLSGILQGHIAYIQVFQQLLQRSALSNALMLQYSYRLGKILSFRLNNLKAMANCSRTRGDGKPSSIKATTKS